MIGTFVGIGLLMVCVGMPCVDALVQERSAAEQRVLKRIRELEGRVTFDKEQPGKPVVNVYLRYRSTTDSDIKLLTV